MIPTPISYARATSLDEALLLLDKHGDDAKLLAGGHSLLPLLKLRLASPKALIDIGRIDALHAIRAEGDRLSIGALVTHDEICRSALVAARLPLLCDVARQVGDPQVRARGTIGGSIVHGDPASDQPAAALALDAIVYLRGSRGEQRQVPIADFFTGPLLTAIGPREIVTHISFRIPQGTLHAAYEKFPHPASGYAVVGAAVLLAVRGSMISAAGVGITGAADTPYEARDVEKALVGKELSARTLELASTHADSLKEMASDAFASADYRRHLVRLYTKRALFRAAGL